MGIIRLIKKICIQLFPNESTSECSHKMMGKIFDEDVCMWCGAIIKSESGNVE
jgi:hypothetical protein